MPIDFSLPPLDDPAAEVLVERYFQPVGARVTLGQPLVLVVTERFEWEIPATTAGTISAILAEPGTTVTPGARLLELEAEATAASTSRAQRAEPQRADVCRATPLARRIATTHGVDLTTVTGSGVGGRITRSDVLESLGGDQRENVIVGGNNGHSTALPDDLHAAITVAQQNGLPNTAAQATAQEIQTTAQSTGSAILSSHSQLPYAVAVTEIDLTALEIYVAQHAPRMARRGIVLDVLACVAHSVVDLLSQHRLLNSAWTEQGIVLWSRVRLAVGQRGNGTPDPIVIPDAADLTVQGIARKLSQSTATPTTTRVATFNLAATGTSWWSEATPTASSAALNVGNRQRRPLVLEQNGVEAIVVRPCCLLTLTYDARVIPQPQDDAFLSSLKQQLEHFAGM